MIATLSFAALAGCGTKSIAKNDETTVSDTVKQTQKQRKNQHQQPEAQKLKYPVMQLLQRNQQTKLLRQMSRLINQRQNQIHQLMNQQILHQQTHLLIFLTAHLLKNLQIIHLLQPSLLLTNMTGYQHTAISSGLQVRQQAKTSMYRVVQ